jgi:hypothetical protein
MQKYISTSIPLPYIDEKTKDKDGLQNDPLYIVWDTRDPQFDEKFLFWRANHNNPQVFVEKYGNAPDIVYQELGLPIPTKR